MSDYLEQLLSLPGMWGAQPSPDGAWVAWTWFRTGPAGDVFAAPSDGSAAPIRLTETPENTFITGWAPDSRSVIVQQDKSGNERYQLFRIDLDNPGHLIPLTDPDPNYFIRGGDLHPNGRWLVYGANRDPATGEEIEQTVIYRHDLETDEMTALAHPERAAYVSVRLSPDGQHIAYTRKDRDPSGTQIWLVDSNGEDDREVLNVGDDVKVSIGSWTPDSQHIVYTAEVETHRVIGLYNIETDAAEILIDDPARNVEWAFMPRNAERIVVMEVEEARLRPSLLDPVSGHEETLPHLPGNLMPLAPVGDGEWIARYYSSTQPTDVVRFALEDPHPAEFTSISRIWERTDLTPADLTQAEDYRWASVDGLSIQGWLYRPEGAATGTVVYVHGGPTSHSQDAINNQIQYFVHRGFNVLDPNYRGSTGFGLGYQHAIRKEGWGGLEQEDIRTGIQALLETGIAEQGQVGITGTSYGGYSSWCAITRFSPEELAAAAPICGMTDLVVDYHTTRPDLRPYSEEMMGGSPEDIPEKYHERSPINYVADISGQVLVVQGMQDPNVTPDNVATVKEALDAATVTYEELAFADEGHGISKPKNQKVLYRRLADFFEASFTHDD